jgi:hypothetical protein
MISKIKSKVREQYAQYACWEMCKMQKNMQTICTYML